MNAEVEEVVRELAAGVERVLGAGLVGVYLRGSLALGDFDPRTSDVDFLVVPRSPLTAAQYDGIDVLHVRLRELPDHFASHLEGSYIDARALRRFAPHERRHPTIGVDWPFGWGEHRDNWVLERSVVRERGGDGPGAGTRDAD